MSDLLWSLAPVRCKRVVSRAALMCTLVFAVALPVSSAAGSPPLSAPGTVTRLSHPQPTPPVPPAAAGHIAVPKSIYHIPRMHGPQGVFASPFGSSSEPTVHYHHGVVCQERNKNGECVHYYAPGLHYRGGEVIKEPKLYLIFYGSNWNALEEDKKWKGALLNTLRGMTTEYAFDETYQRILHQYWDEQTEPKQISNTMTVSGEWTYEGAPAPQNLTEENVELAVNQAIETNHWHREKNAIFMLMEPKGSAWTEEFAKFTECGYHFVDRWSDVYALIPNDNDFHFNSGCVVGTNQRAETETATHEYMEAVTDPHPQEGSTPGWSNSEGYEIADLCDEEPELLNETLSIWVSSVWGNAEKTCVIHDPPENPPSSPTVTTEPATAITYHQASLNGDVNPNEGPEPHYYFEYGTTTSYGSYAPAPPGPGLGSSGGSNVPVSANLSGLKVGTKYHYRLTSSTWAGTGAGIDREFTTPIPAPVVSIEASTKVGDKHATLNGTVNPEESATTYQFEYWPIQKSSEVTRIPAAAESVGSGTSNVKVTQTPTTLSGATEYVYRLSATNAGGTSRSSETNILTGPFTEVQSTPNPTGATESALRAVSCSSATACSSIGAYKNSSGTEVSLGEGWSGTEWKLQTIPAPTGALASKLYGISCTSATACTAVGSYENGSSVVVTLAERWNGSEWTIQTTPNPTGAKSAELYGVSCASSTACTAVGNYYNSEFKQKTLAEKWNGTEWSIQTTPNGPGSINVLAAVSCTASTACTAVGSDYGHTLIARWNGTEWTSQQGAIASEAGTEGLASVVCSAASTCRAVGRYQATFGGRQLNLAEGWNGTAWTLQTAPEPSGSSASELAGLACISSTVCTAAGKYTAASGAELTLVESWNGTEWKLHASVASSGATHPALNGLSCISSTACVFAGGYTNSAGTKVTLAETFGAPTATTEPATGVSASGAKLNATVDPKGSETSYHFEYGLTTGYGTKIPIPDATLASETSSEQVSQTLSGLQPETTYHYRVVATNGSATSNGEDRTFTTSPAPWAVVSTPNPTGATESALNGVSCASTTACSSVGAYKNSSGTEVNLGESWNGTEWKLQTVPVPSGALASKLYGISCTSSTACTAVGSYKNSSSAIGTLAERWNGTEWSVQTTPNPTESKEVELYGVSCTSSTACTAVGRYYNSEFKQKTLAEKWNGTEWSIQATPNGPGTINMLSAVSCTASTACTAVGSDLGHTLIDRWNGTEWTAQQGAIASEFGSEGLAAVICLAANECRAVGRYQATFGGRELNLAEVWNGTAWTLQAAPEPSGTLASELAGLACFSSTACTAAGQYKNSTEVELSLVDGWTGSEWKIQTTPNPTGAKAVKMRGAACPGSATCFAVGSYTNSSGTVVTLAEEN